MSKLEEKVERYNDTYNFGKIKGNSTNTNVITKKVEYCERCNKLREYEIKDETYEIKFQNKLIKYNGKKAVCKYCDTEIFCEEVEEYNQKAFEQNLKESGINLDENMV